MGSPAHAQTDPAAQAATPGSAAEQATVEGASRDAADAQATAQTANPDDIIVTARFRAESVQAAPQAISAYGAAQLERIEAKDLSDLTATTPNVNIQTVTVVRTAAAIVVRGLGASGIESTDESPVGVAMDGIFITRPAASLLDTFDMERVEILRGPQGTSFGKNSLAGGIAAYTRNPGQELKYDVEGTVGNYGRRDLRGAINVPVTDGLAVRLVAGLETIDGWFHNRFNGETVGKSDTLTLRGTIVWNPVDALDINLKGFKVRSRGEQPGADAVPDRTKLLYTLGRHEEPNDGIFTIGRNFPDEQTLDQWGVIGNVSLDLGPVVLTSLTGYIDTHDTQKLDLDQSEVSFFHQLREQQHHQFSQEVRAAIDLSAISTGSNLVIGGYYLDQDFGQTGAFPWILTGPANEDVTFQDNQSKALFAQGIVAIVPGLNVTLGVRHNWESKDFLRDAVGATLTRPVTEIADIVSIADMRRLAESRAALGTALVGSYDRQHTSMKAGVDYKFSDAAMTYFTYAEGYKGGGYGGRAASRTTMGPTADNTSQMFEVGFKGDLFDRKLRLNLAAFQTKFKNLQFPVFFPNPAVASGQESAEQNIGAATTRGVEVEATFRDYQGLILGANVGYLYQRFDDFCADLNGPQSYPSPPTSTCGVATRLPAGTYLVDEDYRFLKLARAPEWQVQLSADKTWDLGASGKVTARASMLYKTEYYQQVTNDPSGLAGPYTIVDAGLGWENESGTLKVNFWGKNLTDKVYVTGVIPTAQFFIQRYWSAPRTIGVTMRLSR